MKKRRILTALICTVTGTTMALNTGSGIFADEKEPVEIISKRSQYEKHYDNGNGTTTAFINTAPLHYYENGQWCEIDNSLEINESGDYVNKSNSMDITLASSASPKTVNTVGNDQMVQLEYNGYTISWDMINTQQNSSHISASSTVQLVTKNSAEDVNFTLGGEKLTEKASACLDKLNSSVVYDSVFEDVDVSLDILPSSIKETIILNDKDSVPEQFAYYIIADGLDAELQADNSIEFTNEQDEVIFTMPAMFMFDSSSEIPEYNYDIETAIAPIKNGYLLTITPDSNWLNSDDRVYPVMIDPEVTTNFNASTFYVYEAASTATYSNSYLRIGGNVSTGSRYETVVYCPNFTSNVTDMTAIKEAKLHLSFALNSYSGNNNPIEVYSLNNRFTYPYWTSCGGNNISSTYISTSEIPEYASGNIAFDITSSVQTHINYARSGSYVGSHCYGYKLKTEDSDNTDSRLFLAFSERSNQTAPYFEVTYITNTTYTMDYTPHKYNNLIADSEHTNSSSLYNFQNRMNCYAYALQVYYRDYSSDATYYLKPGEFGINQDDTNNTYKIATYGDLEDIYEDLEYDMKSPYSKYYPPTYVAEMSEFVDEQLHNDANALNFELTQICTSTFSLPETFDESSERIIAMFTYYNYYTQDADYHFYLRNGNGTCSNGHGGNCSMWTHKQGAGPVKNTCASNEGITLCDQNISEYATSLTGTITTSTVNYYTITKNTNIYNSWHGYGQSENAIGTPYRP